MNFKNGDIKIFDKYLLNRNNKIVLKMYLLMRWIHEAFMFLRMITNNYMKERGLIFIPLIVSLFL